METTTGNISNYNGKMHKELAGTFIPTGLPLAHYQGIPNGYSKEYFDSLVWGVTEDGANRSVWIDPKPFYEKTTSRVYHFFFSRNQVELVRQLMKAGVEVDITLRQMIQNAVAGV